VTTFDQGMPYLPERNAAVEAIIDGTARKHALIDFAVDGAAGLSPIPGTQAVFLAGQLVTQTKLLYPPMIRKISAVYGAKPDAYTRLAATAATLGEGVGNALVMASESGVLEDLGAELQRQLAVEFGSEFIARLIQDALGESVAGLALAQVPWIGVPAGATVAALLAWKLTWRLGLTVSAWFQNGGSFVGGSRASTVTVIKDLYVHGRRPTSMTGTVDRIRLDIDEVRKNMTAYLVAKVEAARAEGQSDADIRSALVAQAYPLDVIESALGPWEPE
jgi:uncharacterized protein (DUF697 family)